MRLSVVLVALVAACAGEPLSEDEVYRRQNAEILRAERYERFKRACQGSGGIVVVRTRRRSSTTAWASARSSSYRWAEAGSRKSTPCLSRTVSGCSILVIVALLLGVTLLPAHGLDRHVLEFRRIQELYQELVRLRPLGLSVRATMRPSV